MRLRIVQNVLALTVCLPALALAQRMPALAPEFQREGTWELTVAANATYLDNQVTCCLPGLAGMGKLTPGGELRLGYHLSRMWSLSIGSGLAYSSPATIIQPFASISWTPNIDARTSPFVTLGAGVTSVHWSTSSPSGSWRFTGKYGAHIGVGVRRMLSDRLALRVEVREQVEHDSAPPFPVYSGVASVGLSWFVGGRRIPVRNVAVNPPTATLAALGATEQLAATPMDIARRPLARRVVTWSSSNDAVATVSATGLVTAVANGSATITATSETASGRVTVTVAQAPATLAVTPATATLTALGQTQQLAVSGQDANQNPIANPQVTWMSSNASAVTVNSSGLATAVRNGTATITAGATGGPTATATLTVAQAVTSVTVAPTAATVTAAGGQTQFTLVAADANGRPVTGKVITWATSAPAVATFGPGGVATAVANGTTQITATVEGVTGSATFTVAIPAAAAPAAVALPTAVNTSVVLKSVNFRPNSSRLPPEATAELDAVAEAMKALPNARWEIGGYTSSMGNPARNQVLSRRRALVVRLYLNRHGVPFSRLVAVGYGAQNPIASNRTVAGRRANMRVEIKRLR
jgi:outer membrane protein OmpA-like peptidoglycan-associated protein